MMSWNLHRDWLGYPWSRQNAAAVTSRPRGDEASDYMSTATSMCSYYTAMEDGLGVLPPGDQVDLDDHRLTGHGDMAHYTSSTSQVDLYQDNKNTATPEHVYYQPINTGHSDQHLHRIDVDLDPGRTSYSDLQLHHHPVSLDPRALDHGPGRDRQTGRKQALSQPAIAKHGKDPERFPPDGTSYHNGFQVAKDIPRKSAYNCLKVVNSLAEA